MRPTPTVSLVLIAVHSTGIWALAPWIVLTRDALAIFVLAWILGEFLGHFITVMLADTVARFEWSRAAHCRNDTGRPSHGGVADAKWKKIADSEPIAFRH